MARKGTCDVAIPATISAMEKIPLSYRMRSELAAAKSR
jgi:hypothetical protein